jgi:hypothetical protein
VPQPEDRQVQGTRLSLRGEREDAEMNAIPMIGQCMKLQEARDLGDGSWTIAWTPDLYVMTGARECDPNRIPVLMLKVDGLRPRVYAALRDAGF